MPLGMAVDLRPGCIVLDGAPPSLAVAAKRSLVSASVELLLYRPNRNINMNFEEKIKTTYKEVAENADASSKNLKSELKK